MAQNRDSLSQLTQRRSNRILLIIGLMLLMLFLLALCRLSSKKAPQNFVPEGGPSGVDVVIGSPTDEGDVPPVFKRGDAELKIIPDNHVVMEKVVLGSVAEKTLTLRADNAGVKILSKSLDEKNSPFQLSGDCMEKDILATGESCLLKITWSPKELVQIQNTLTIQWIEDNPGVFDKQTSVITLSAQSTDSKDCIICKCDEKVLPDVPREASTLEGEKVPVNEKGEPIIDGVPHQPVGTAIVDPKGHMKGVIEPEVVPLSLTNELLGEVQKNKNVVDFDGNTIGRLMGDNTIVNSKFEIVGKAIDMVPAMKENGEVIGKMKVDGKTVVIVDAKDRVIGRPQVDGRVVDMTGKHIAYLSPWGLVIDFQGNILGGVYPDGKVVNTQGKVVATMRPMGLAISKAGGLIGGVMPRGTVVAPGCNSFGNVGVNGKITDALGKDIGHVLLDGTVVNAQNSELGMVVREGLIIDSKSQVIGYVNTAGKGINTAGDIFGCVNPDGSVFSKEKFVGALMPQGRVIRESCGQVGSVYPDASVLNDELKVVGRVYPDGDVLDAKHKYLGMVAPKGTAIGPNCQLLGLISLNGTVVSPDGARIGCLTRNKEVLSPQGDTIGQVTPTGILMDEQNKVMGRVGLDGQIYDSKGAILGCVNSSQNLTTVLTNKGVVIDENGFAKAWSFSAGKVYDSENKWIGDVFPNGIVVGNKRQLVGVVPLSGPIFTDKGELIGFYDQKSGYTLRTNGEVLGRLLPGKTVINEQGTEILGRLIETGTTFVDLNGVIVGVLQPDGTLKNQNQKVEAKIYANGTVVNAEGQMLGAAVHSGTVLNGAGKFVGLAKPNADVVDEKNQKVGRLLANGLAVSVEGKVLGRTFPELSIPVSVGGSLGSVVPQLVPKKEVSGYQAQVHDDKGNLVGSVSAFGSVLGGDESIKGHLVPLNVFVNEQGRLMGWANFAGGMNNPDGYPIASVLPSGAAIGSAQEIQGFVVPHTIAVDTLGQFLGTMTSRGEILSPKGEVLAHVGSSSFLYDEQGILLGRLLAPGVALDNNGQYMGWTRYDGQIEDGKKVLGSVGLDGHVFDDQGTMIGFYLPLGLESFAESGKSLGFVNEEGQVQGINGALVGQSDAYPFVRTNNGGVGRFMDLNPFANRFYNNQGVGVLNEEGLLKPLHSTQITGQAQTNDFVVDNMGQTIGGVVKRGLATATTLGALGVPFINGQVKTERKISGAISGNGLVFSPKGEILGGVYAPAVVIDKKGAYAGSTGATSGVFVKGRQVGHRLAFRSALSPDSNWIGHTMPHGVVVGATGEFLGTVRTDGSVVKKDGSFLGQILPDGVMAQVSQKGVLNTMPYGGHVVAQGLPVGYNQKVLGRTTAEGDLVDYSNKKLERILDTGIIFGKDTSLAGIVLPFMSAVSDEGRFLGTLTATGEVVSFDGNKVGRVANNGTIKGAEERQILGALVPEPLVVNNCKVVGQTAYDGRIINGQGMVMGRIRKDRWALDAQNKEIGRTVRTGAVMSPDGVYMGRTLPDSIVVDLNGVEMACAKNDGSVEKYDGTKIGFVVEPTIVLDSNGEIKGVVGFDGKIRNSSGTEIGTVLGDGKGTAIGLDGNPFGRAIDTLEETVMDASGKVLYTIKPVGNLGEILSPDGQVLFHFDPNKGGDPLTPDGQVCPSMIYIRGIGCLQGCDLIGIEGNKIASIKPDGTMRDANNDIYATVLADGQVFAPNNQYMGQFVGVNVNFLQCGIDASKNSGRTLFIGGREVQVDSNGTIVDENGNVLGYFGENGRPFTLDGKAMDANTISGRERPPEPQPIKVDPEQITAIQDLMKKKRSLMRERLGGQPAIIPSPELLARGREKKDKDWTKMGIEKSVSSWPVDMSHVILQGKAISAVLARPIDSRYPTSPALAIVDTNIYGEEGRNILIPAGSRLIGTFASGAGSDSVPKIDIIWDRLIRPDGSAFNLGGASSGDTMGRGGVAAYLDKQLWNKYGNPVLSAMAESFLISVSPASGEVGASSASTGNISGRAKKQQEIRDIWTGLGEDILDKMIEDADAVPPVVYVPAGTRFVVFVKQDLWLRSPEDDEEEVNKEYGAPSTAAQRPQGISESSDVRRQRQNNIVEETETEPVSAPKDTKKKNKDPEPLYNGSEQMPADLSERVAKPSAPTQTAPIF